MVPMTQCAQESVDVFNVEVIHATLLLVDSLTSRSEPDLAREIR